MKVVLRFGAALSWIVGALAIIAGPMAVQILGGLAIVNGTVAFAAAAIIDALQAKEPPVK